MIKPIKVPNLYYNESVAFCFIVTKDLSKEHIWREWFEKLDIPFNIYVHVDDKRKIKSPWLKNYLIPHNIPTSWDDHMEAELTLLRYSLENSNDAWFINLSESTIPFIPPSKFKKLFDKYKNNTILNYKKIWWDPKYESRGNVMKFHPSARIGNSEWCVLCNEDMRNIIYAWNNTKIVNTIMEEPHADESIFSVTLYLTNKFKNTINSFVTIMDWERDPYGPSPHTFTEYSKEDERIIKDLSKDNEHAMFIRKISSEFPDKIIYSWLKIK